MHSNVAQYERFTLTRLSEMNDQPLGCIQVITTTCIVGLVTAPSLVSDAHWLDDPYMAPSLQH